MCSRKRSRDVSFDHDASVLDDVRPKRLFRSDQGHEHSQTRTLTSQRVMTQLTEFILKNEEAFQNQHRIASLYTDFRGQLALNPDGYNANIAAWTKALTDAAREGVITTQGATHDLLSIRASDDLARALQHPQYGKPTCLPAVFYEAVKRKEMLPVTEFLSASESIYKTSWIPSPWTVLQWGLRQVLGQKPVPDKLPSGDFVVLKNVEMAADQILKQMRDVTSTVDRVLSRAEFLKRFSNTLGPTVSLTGSDLNIVLAFLARDKQAISCNAHAIKFKLEHEAVPPPITEDDAAIAGLRDTLGNVNAQLQLLMEKIEEANAAAKEAVAAKQMGRAKAALRSKKLAESALAQRTDISLQLERVYADLQQSAEQVEIVGAMRAGAEALRSLHEQVGGAEGVQGVVDAVNEQMAVTEEIANIISDSDRPLDEAEIDDEFEELEKADREKRETEEARRTAARLAQLEGAERKRVDKEAAEKHSGENIYAEGDVFEASQSLSQLSFAQSDDEEEEEEEEEEEKEGEEEEKRIALPA